MATVGIAGKQHVQMQQQQFFQRQEAMLAVFPRQRHKPRNLLRNRQQRFQRAVIGFPLQLQRQRKPGVRDKRKRMRRVDRQGRQHREHLVQKVIFQKLLVPRRQLAAGQQGNPLRLHQLFQLVEHRLLGVHQPPRVGMDQHQLFRRSAAIFRGVGILRPHQGPQPRHPHSVEFIKVGGRNRQKPQPLQQRHRRV
ncbi:MAG: hypothetical protein ACD_54C00565G0001 [uncultured bacterium]|nr:MAG: hypothetical protein ACD_54C00565G0001 [uncultured bacterium]